MGLLLRLLAIHAAIAGILAVVAFGALRLLKKNPSFASVFLWCGIALFALGQLVTYRIRSRARMAA